MIYGILFFLLISIEMILNGGLSMTVALVYLSIVSITSVAGVQYRLIENSKETGLTEKELCEDLILSGITSILVIAGSFAVYMLSYWYGVQVVNISTIDREIVLNIISGLSLIGAVLFNVVGTLSRLSLPVVENSRLEE